VTNPVIFNEAERQYEQEIDGHIVFAKIRKQDGTLYINHVEAPAALRGTGAAGRFMNDFMQLLRAEDVKKVVPFCGYAAHWLSKHPEYSDIAE